MRSSRRAERSTFILSILAATAFLSLHGCDDDEAATDSPAVATTTQTGATPDEAAPSQAGGDPTGAAACAVFTEALVRDALELEPEVEVTANESRAHCAYSWPRDLTEEERAEMARVRMARARELMKKVGSGNPIGTTVEMPRDTNRVVMHFSIRNPQDAAEAIAAFEEDIVTDREMTRLDENGDEESFVESHEPIEGVGDRAVWLSREHSLMVLDEDRAQVFYIEAEVAMEDDANLPHAKALATAILVR